MAVQKANFTMATVAADDVTAVHCAVGGSVLWELNL